MAAEMAVESTVKEEIIQTMVKEEASEKREASTEKDVHSERTLKEEASAATDHVVHSLMVAREGRHSMVKEDHSERILKEEATAATDHVVHSQRVAREDRHSAVKEDLHSLEREEASVETEETQEVSGTQARRASIRRTSTISVTRKRAESTR